MAAPDGTAVVYESGTHNGVVCGPDNYGRIVLIFAHSPLTVTANGVKVERSADGGTTYATITSGVTVTLAATNVYKIVDARPTLGSQAQASLTSGSVKYRLTATSSGTPSTTAIGTTSALAAQTNPNFVIQRLAQLGHNYISTHGDTQNKGLTGYVPGGWPPETTGAEVLQPGQWLLFGAYNYWKAVQGGWTSPTPAQLLADTQNQWNYIKVLQTAPSGLVILPGYSSWYHMDAVLRVGHHALVSSRILRQTGNSSAITLADDMVTRVQTWVKKVLDDAPRATYVYPGAWINGSYLSPVMAHQPAWQANKVYALGDVCTSGSRSYRVVQVTGNARSGATSPSFPNSNGGEVTETTAGGSVKWKDVVRVYSGLVAQDYSSPASTWPPYLATQGPQGEQGAITYNKQIGYAALLAMLCNEPGATLFYSAGTYRTDALSQVDKIVDGYMSGIENDGSIIYAWVAGLPWGHDYYTHDTLYGGYGASLLALIRYDGAAQSVPLFDTLFNRNLDWLSSFAVSEPLTKIHHAGVGDVLSPGGDLTLRAAAALQAGRIDPSQDLLYTAAFNNPDTGKWTYYSQWGGGEEDLDRFLEDEFEGWSYTALFSASTTAPEETGTLHAAGTHLGIVCGCDKYSINTLVYEHPNTLETVSQIKVERSSNNSTWVDISSQAYITRTNLGSNNWKIIDRRPQYGSQAVGYGETVYYRVTPGNAVGNAPSPTSSVGIVADVNKAAVRQASYSVLSSFMGTQPAGAITSQAGAYYPGETLLSMALAYYESTLAGAPNSTYLTNVTNQYNSAIVPLIDSNGVLHFPAFSTTDRDYHCRTAGQVAIASRLLDFAGQTNLSNAMLITANTMGKAFWDKFGAGSPTAIHTRASYDPAGQTAWQANVAYTAGDIVRASSNNGHTYRAMTSGVSSSVQPTMQTSEGASFTDNAGVGHSATPITWKETSVTAECSVMLYAVASPYTRLNAPTVDPNKNASEAALMALLVTDPRSDFYNSGTYQTKALTHISNVSKLVAACQGSGGKLSLGDAWPVGADAWDTLYAAYTLQQLSLVYHLVGAVVPELPLVLSSTLRWLETRSGGASEPQTRIGYGGRTDVGIGDLQWRALTATTLHTTSVVEKLPYTSAWWDPATARYTPYTVNGGGTPYSAIYQPVWEAEAILALVAPSSYTGWGENLSSGTGVATSVLPVPTLRITPTANWRQEGQEIYTVAPLDNTRYSTTARIYAPMEGYLIFDGIHANRFSASLDGQIWSSTISLASGVNSIYIGVEALAGDTILTARVGLPIIAQVGGGGSNPSPVGGQTWPITLTVG